jgi:hypothetical protein
LQIGALCLALAGVVLATWPRGAPSVGPLRPDRG